ncbi:RidA family protein [Staphylococcus shinii]|uniref:RidA family protein n=1 Tax=Staphylococcus shinii TaxID=2912228 RepID=UPI003F557AD2
MLELINTEKGAKAIGPYSQAVKTNNFLFVSGQLPMNPETNELVENDIIKQTHQVLENVNSIIQNQNLDVSNIIKNTIFIKNMEDFPKINEVYGQYFKSHQPARSTVEVSNLPKDALIEIETIVSFENSGKKN